jgi:hypothetical protein
LHGVVDFSWYGLLRRMCGILLYFSFRLKEDVTIFGSMVGFTALEHAVRRFECVRASTATSATIWCAASLATCVNLWSEVLGYLSCGGVPKFFFQFSGGTHPSELILCTSLG